MKITVHEPSGAALKIIKMDQVRWFANAIQYWDHNVFCDKASTY